MANGNGKAQAASAVVRDKEDLQMEDLREQIRETAILFGGLAFAPFMFFLGAAYGIRAGIIVALKKTIQLMQAWNR